MVGLARRSTRLIVWVLIAPGLNLPFDAGYLISILVDEALPGDTFSLNMTGFARLATPIYPIMANIS